MTAITTAARLLRVAADELKNAHTLGGDWGNEHEALDAYNEHMATATTLEHMARQCLQQIEEPSGAAPAAVAPLPAVFEQIAQSWDGCMYDAPGETLDIGADIRAAAKRLLAEHPAAVAPQGEYPQLPEGVMFIEQIGGEVIGRPTDYGFKHGRGIVHGAELFTSEQLQAYFDLGRQHPAAPALEAPAAPAQDMESEQCRCEPSDWSPPAGYDGDGSVAAMARAALAAAPQTPALEAPESHTQALRAIADWPVTDMLMNMDAANMRGIAQRALAAAPQAPAAPWKDHQTARLVNDLRDCAIKYHGAGQLRERIAHIVVPLCDQLKGALAAPAAPAVDATSDTALLDAMQRHRIALVPEFEGPWDAEIFNDEAEAPLIASGNTPREALHAALAAQAKEGGEA
ncbi:hypothetical protein [Delftia sp. UME58]|uniref:hypothetical protein n=1 Tax=Delftia sp. UME58 TaxID=1862322 RepID=UPI0015FF7DAD|nr:hypothetical protein [Delftia sp. UME58]MBB1651641.1 hypothetical protein [Delftia sp. UME58]